MATNREPGNAEVFDLFTTADKQPTARRIRLEEQGKDLRKYKRWQVRWNDAEGNQKSRSFRRKVDATKFKDEITTQLHRGEYIDHKLSRTTVQDVYERWEPTTVHNAEKTRYDRRNAWKNHVSSKWADREIGSVTKAEIQGWVAELHEDGYGQSLISRCVEVLRQVLSFAVDAGLLRVNPATGIKVPRANKPDRFYLTVRQSEALAKAIDVRYKALIRIFTYCGLRWGEATALQGRDVDLVRGRLEVRRAFSTVGGKRILKDTKTNERRSVPFPEVVRQDLVELLSDLKGNDFLFTTEGGTPLNPSNFRNREYLPALEAAGRAVGAPLPPVTVHDLRHTAASLAISSGANVKAVQRMLGHKSAKMTLDTYADLFDDDLDGVVVRMNELISCETSVKPRK